MVSGHAVFTCTVIESINIYRRILNFFLEIHASVNHVHCTCTVSVDH